MSTTQYTRLPGSRTRSLASQSQKTQQRTGRSTSRSSSSSSRASSSASSSTSSYAPTGSRNRSRLDYSHLLITHGPSIPSPTKPFVQSPSIAKAYRPSRRASPRRSRHERVTSPLLPADLQPLPEVKICIPYDPRFDDGYNWRAEEWSSGEEYSDSDASDDETGSALRIPHYRRAPLFPVATKNRKRASFKEAHARRFGPLFPEDEEEGRLEDQCGRPRLPKSLLTSPQYQPWERVPRPIQKRGAQPQSPTTTLSSDSRSSCTESPSTTSSSLNSMTSALSRFSTTSTSTSTSISSTTSSSSLSPHLLNYAKPSPLPAIASIISVERSTLPPLACPLPAFVPVPCGECPLTAQTELALQTVGLASKAESALAKHLKRPLLVSAEEGKSSLSDPAKRAASAPTVPTIKAEKSQSETLSSPPLPRFVSTLLDSFPFSLFDTSKPSPPPFMPSGPAGSRVDIPTALSFANFAALIEDTPEAPSDGGEKGLYLLKPSFMCEPDEMQDLKPIQPPSLRPVMVEHESFLLVYAIENLCREQGGAPPLYEARFREMLAVGYTYTYLARQLAPMWRAPYFAEVVNEKKYSVRGVGRAVWESSKKTSSLRYEIDIKAWAAEEEEDDDEWLPKSQWKMPEDY